MITPKEQVLKQVRKNLVQPLANPFPNYVSQSKIKEYNELSQEFDFVSNWNNNGFLFVPCDGIYDAINFINSKMIDEDISQIYSSEKKLIETIEECGIIISTKFDSQIPLVSTCLKIESRTNMICFSSEINNLKYINSSEKLIILAKKSQIDLPEKNKYFTEQLQRNDLIINLKIDYLKKIKEVILLLDVKN